MQCPHCQGTGEAHPQPPKNIRIIGYSPHLGNYAGVIDSTNVAVYLVQWSEFGLNDRLLRIGDIVTASLNRKSDDGLLVYETGSRDHLKK